MPVLDFPLWLNVLGVLVSIVAVIALDGLIAHICHKLQNRVNPFSRFFSVSKRQKNVLGALGAKRYKKFLPDLGALVKFPKKKIAQPGSKEYIGLYLAESASGEAGHWIGAAAGFLIIFMFPLKYYLCFGIPVAAVNFILCVLPALALRYNRYSLQVIYKGLERRENVRVLTSIPVDGIAPQISEQIF